MYWAIGYDEHWNRDIGFDVPAICDHPGCKSVINRGIDHVCGGEPYGGDAACGLYFCKEHLQKKPIVAGEKPVPVCAQCSSNQKPFEPTSDIEEWVSYKQNSNYWAGWRTYHDSKAGKSKG